MQGMMGEHMIVATALLLDLVAPFPHQRKFDLHVAI
jgi:hypothetical protein